MRIAFQTFGCKINQYETDVMRQDAAGAGNLIVPFDAEADVYIVNTCSVTSKSDSQCRQAIRAAARHGKQVIVTGCYAETRREEVASIEGVTQIVGNRQKHTILECISSNDISHPDNDTPEVVTRSPSDRTRGFLKIQDGCNGRCTYCIVPIARGTSVSVPSDDVVRKFLQLIDTGYPEIVLSGIHIGKYGADLANNESLSTLLIKLLALRKSSRLRLSSIEPTEVTDEIVGMLGNGLCRHLHIPLQSGDDSILRAMNRVYRPSEYKRVVEGIASKVPGIAIGADVMVGFPGETDKAFQNTVQLIMDTPLTHLHVFSYSARPGTPAASMDGQVPEFVKKERNAVLRDLGLKKNLEFRKTLIGKKLDVIPEHNNHENRHMSGLSDNYIRVSIEDEEKDYLKGRVEVMITRVYEAKTWGVLI